MLALSPSMKPPCAKSKPFTIEWTGRWKRWVKRHGLAEGVGGSDFLSNLSVDDVRGACLARMNLVRRMWQPGGRMTCAGVWGFRCNMEQTLHANGRRARASEVRPGSPAVEITRQATGKHRGHGCKICYATYWWRRSCRWIKITKDESGSRRGRVKEGWTRGNATPGYLLTRPAI